MSDHAHLRRKHGEDSFQLASEQKKKKNENAQGGVVDTINSSANTLKERCNS